MNNNKLFLISGVSGSGKTSIMKHVLYNEIVSITTRDKRQGEIDGIDYYFTDVKLFEELIETDSLIESIYYCGNYYGFSIDEVESKLELGNAYAIVNYDGYKQLRRNFPNSIGIYLEIDRLDALYRMKLRGDTKENIEERMADIDSEPFKKGCYDYIVKNDEGMFKQAIENVKTIINLETNKGVTINAKK